MGFTHIYITLWFYFIRMISDIAWLISDSRTHTRTHTLTHTHTETYMYTYLHQVLTPNGDATELGLYRFFGSCIKVTHLHIAFLLAWFLTCCFLFFLACLLFCFFMLCCPLLYNFSALLLPSYLPSDEIEQYCTVLSWVIICTLSLYSISLTHTHHHLSCS